MKQCIIMLSAIIFPVLISNPAFAEGDPVKGKAFYATCAACHGVNGEGLQATNSPRLSGLDDFYLVSQLEKFRSGLRGGNPKDIFGSQMAAMAKILPNEQALSDVVAYIGMLRAGQPPRTENSGDLVQGKKDFEGSCARCHGIKGQGFKDLGSAQTRLDFPRLSGQHDWYLIRQLRNFKAGIRGSLMDKAGMQMRAMAKVTLSNDQIIKDIVAHIGTLE